MPASQRPKFLFQINLRALILLTLFFCTTAHSNPIIRKNDLIYVISLHGMVGVVEGHCKDQPFTAYSLDYFLREAKQNHPSIVILDISGPGGLVDEMHEMVKIIYEYQLQGMRIVAFPRDAFSAWSTVALSCKEIIVASQSRMGAAITVIQNSAGVIIEAPVKTDAVSQKHEAVWQALWGSVTQFTGHSNFIYEAMHVQASELWWSPTSGFANNGGTGPGLICLDDKVSVCCLSGAEMIKTRIAMAAIVKEDLSDPKSINLRRIFNLSSEGSILYNNYTDIIYSKPLPADVFRSTQRVKQVALHNIQKSLNSLLALNFEKEIVQHPRALPENGMFAYEMIDEPESDSEVKTRISNSISKIKRGLPYLSKHYFNSAIVVGIREVHDWLRKATESSRHGDFTGSKTHIIKACRLLDCLVATHQDPSMGFIP